MKRGLTVPVAVALLAAFFAAQFPLKSRNEGVAPGAGVFAALGGFAR